MLSFGESARFAYESRRVFGFLFYSVRADYFFFSGAFNWDVVNFVCVNFFWRRVEIDDLV